MLHPRWKDPRASIACSFKDNDFGYATHGTLAGLTVLRTLDLKPSECAKLTILDYGCGTGREARLLSSLFKQVIAFDPTPECLTEFKKENKKCGREFNNITIVGDANEIPKGVIDVAYSMHVIEHLDDEDAQFMINQLRAKVKGKTVLAYHATSNKNVLAPFLTREIQEDDATRARAEQRLIRIRLLDFTKTV